MKSVIFSRVNNNYSALFVKFFSTIQTSIHTLIGKNSPVTRIRIWRSGYFLETSTQQKFIPTSVVKAFLAPFTKGVQSNIGHVSIETREIYASLWPEGITIFNKYKPQQGFANNSNPDIDEQQEARPPDYVVDLYTLDVENIKESLDEYIKSGAKYHLIGSNRFIKYLEANSCSGLAYDLLVSGGIKKLVPTPNLVRDYIITTPNNLAQFVLQAHANEQAILKSTSNISDKPNQPSNKP